MLTIIPPTPTVVVQNNYPMSFEIFAELATRVLCLYVLTLSWSPAEGDIAEWWSDRLQSDRSMVQIGVSPNPFCELAKQKLGLNRDLNPGPLAPKARIIPLDH